MKFGSLREWVLGRSRRGFSMNFDFAVRKVDVRPASAIPIDGDGSVLIDARDLAGFTNHGQKILRLGREECHPGPYLAAQSKSDLQNTCALGVHPLTLGSGGRLPGVSLGPVHLERRAGHEARPFFCSGLLLY
jgi:hypothetical protein